MGSWLLAGRKGPQTWVQASPGSAPAPAAHGASGPSGQSASVLLRVTVSRGFGFCSVLSAWGLGLAAGGFPPVALQRPGLCWSSPAPPRRRQQVQAWALRAKCALSLPQLLAAFALRVGRVQQVPHFPACVPPRSMLSDLAPAAPHLSWEPRGEGSGEE